MAKKSILNILKEKASKAYDQLNPFDNGLTTTQRTPTGNQSFNQQAAHVGSNIIHTVADPLAQFPLDVGSLAYNRLIAPRFNLPQQNIQQNPVLGGAARTVGATGTAKQAIGSGIQTGLTIGTGGIGRGAAAVAGKVLPRTIPAVLARAVPNVATGAVVGGGFGAGQGISQGHTARQILTQDVPVGALIGGAAPAAGAALGAGGRAAAKTYRGSSLSSESGSVAASEGGSATPTFNKLKTKADGKLKTKPSDRPINTKYYNISPAAKQDLQDQALAQSADIKATKGQPLTFKEIAARAKTTNAKYQTERTREQTLESSAKIKGSRDTVARLVERRQNGEPLSSADHQTLIKQIHVVQSHATDAGRKLNAFKAMADPADQDIIASAIKDLSKKGHQLDALLERAKQFDLNDPKQLAAFYREFEKATKEDWLDKLRYSSMLSSPITHIRNASANIVGGTVITPARKLAEGAVDATRAALTGGARTRFAGEAGAYAKGFTGAVSEAKRAFSDTFSGRRIGENPDMNLSSTLPLATSGAAGVADNILSFTGRLMEAADQFGLELAKGGETKAISYRNAKLEPANAKGEYRPASTQIRDITAEAESRAQQQLFRGELGGAEQGKLLQAIDWIPNMVLKARKDTNPVVRNTAKLFFPFVKTPTNIIKQMIEYSPLGLATTVGAADKTAQIAKAVLGTTAFTGAGAALAADGRLSFSAPTDTAEKDRFYAEGKQPYSVKIGNKWVSYQYLHPAISFQLAAMASVKQALDSGKIDDSTATKILQGVSNARNFFIDQSYFKNGQDFLDSLQGKNSSVFSTATSAAASNAANTTSQFIPFRALATWLNNMTDGTQRKVDYSASFLDQFGQDIARQLPGLSNKLPARTDAAGNPVMKPHPVINAFSPAKVSTDTGQNPLSDIYTEKKNADHLKKVKDDFKTSGSDGIAQLPGGKFYTKVGDKYFSYGTQAAATKAKAINSFKKSKDQQATINGVNYYKAKDGSVRTSTARATSSGGGSPGRPRTTISVPSGKITTARAAPAPKIHIKAASTKSTGKKIKVRPRARGGRITIKFKKG